MPVAYSQSAGALKGAIACCRRGAVLVKVGHACRYRCSDAITRRAPVVASSVRRCSNQERDEKQ